MRGQSRQSRNRQQALANESAISSNMREAASSENKLVLLLRRGTSPAFQVSATTRYAPSPSVRPQPGFAGRTTAFRYRLLQ